MVLDCPTAGQGGWYGYGNLNKHIGSDWTGKIVQYSKSDPQRGIECHSFGAHQWLPFFVLAPID